MKNSENTNAYDRQCNTQFEFWQKTSFETATVKTKTLKAANNHIKNQNIVQQGKHISFSKISLRCLTCQRKDIFKSKPESSYIEHFCIVSETTGGCRFFGTPKPWRLLFSRLVDIMETKGEISLNGEGTPTTENASLQVRRNVCFRPR